MSLKGLDDLGFEIKREEVKVPDNLREEMNKAVNRAGRIKVYRKGSKITAILSVIIMVMGINISPTFAKVMSEIPIVGDVVMALKVDKGIDVAVERGYIQPLDNVMYGEEYRLELESIIADESRIIFEGTYYDKAGVLDGIDDTYSVGSEIINGEIMEMGIYFTIRSYDETEYGMNYRDIINDGYNIKLKRIGEGEYKLVYDGTLTRSGSLTKKLKIEFDGIRSNFGERRGFYNDSFKVGSKDFTKLELSDEFLGDFNMESEIADVSIGDIAYDVEKMEISPASTRIVLNEKGYSEIKLVDIRDMYLEDENGNTYKLVWNKTKTRHRNYKGEIEQFGYIDAKFESAYYNNPKKLTLKGKALYVNKGQRPLFIDVKDKKMDDYDNFVNPELMSIKKLDDEKGTIQVVIKDENEAIDHMYSSWGYSRTNECIDENGNKYDVSCFWKKSHWGGYEEIDDQTGHILTIRPRNIGDKDFDKEYMPEELEMKLQSVFKGFYEDINVNVFEEEK